MRLAVILMVLAGPAFGAVATPDWPCVQRKQPSLSLGQMWTGPEPVTSQDPDLRALAEALAQRRLPIEDAEAKIADFAAGADDARLAALMAAVLAQINPDRDALIAGISRYGHAQVALAQRIEERRAKVAGLEAAPHPDFDAIDAEEKALDLDRRVFEDRAASLTYVCETPVILEQRAFALARAIAAHLSE